MSNEISPRSGGRAAASRARFRTRRRRPLAALALCSALSLVAAACSSGGGDGPGAAAVLSFEAGDTIAELHLGAPGVDRFYLHGTVPVPQGFFPRSDGRMPFTVIDQDGNITEAQVEIVSRYPNPSDGADVVEVISRVRRPVGAVTGQRISYGLLYETHALTPHARNATVQSLLDAPDSVVLRTRDVFGNLYEADLLADLRTSGPDLVTLRDGKLARQVRTHEVLLPSPPVGGASGTLPHMMGAHSYVTTWNLVDYLSLDLRVHNGGSGFSTASSADDPLGDVYFSELELVLPNGWVLHQAFDTPTAGAPYSESGKTVWPLITPLAGGKMHLMPSQAQLHRRLVITRGGAAETEARGALAEHGLGFCQPGTSPGGKELLSWWNSGSARYFPQNEPLPRLEVLDSVNLRNADAILLSDTAAAMAAGTTGPYPIVSPAIGWAHPWGPAVGSMHGGSEIFLYDGLTTAWSASQDGYRMYQLTHRMTSDRQPVALFDEDGEPTNTDAWIQNGPNGPYLPLWVFLNPVLFLGDPFGFGAAPTFQRDAVVAQGRQPDYEADLLAYEPIDIQHQIRYTRSPKVLAWLGNDALAKDDLKMAAELMLMSYHPLPQSATNQNIVTGMYRDREFVDGHPGEGFNINRGEGWLFDTVVAAYALSDPTWRSRVYPWCEEVVDLVGDGQSTCFGNLGSVPNDAHFGGLYRVRQSISEAILENALYGMRSSVFQGRDDAQSTRLGNVVSKSAYAMISDLVWSFADNRVWFYVAVGDHDQEQDPFCNFVPPGAQESTDNYQVWSSFAHAYRITGDGMFLTRADQMAAGNILGLMTHNDGKRENASALLALIQELGP